MASVKRRVPLTRKRKEHAEANGGMVFWGEPLDHPHVAESRYAATLHKAVAAMIAESHRELDRVWTAHGPAVISGMDASLASQSRILMNGMAQRFQAFFDKLAPGLAKRTVDQVAQHSQTALHSSLKELSGGLSLKTSVLSGQIEEVTKAATAANIALIKSIPQKYFTDLQGAVMRSIQSEQGTKTVLDAVNATGEVAKKRATLIATDQTRKVTTAVNSARLKSLGVKKFEWLHSSGGRKPRELHLHTLNGNIFDLHNPPVIDDKTGERGLPGQLINCRCRMIPVIDFGGGGK